MTHASAKLCAAWTALFCVMLVLAVAPARADAPYTVEIEGVGDKELRAQVVANSYLVRFSERPPLTVEGLNRRAADDKARLLVILKGRGHYAAKVRTSVTSGADKARVVLNIDPGPIFTVQDFDVSFTGEPPEHAEKIAEPAKQAKGRPATPDIILGAESNMLGLLRENGFPAPKLAERGVVVDHATKTAHVSLILDPGAPAVFGDVNITGMKTIDEAYLRRRVAVKKGARYDASKLRATREKLKSTGLLADIDVDEDTAGGAEAPVNVTVKEGKHRSIGAGVEYSTSTSFGTNVFWEHRNFFGSGEKLRLDLEGSVARQAAKAALTKPDLFGNIDRSLKLGTGYAQESFDAYDSRSYSLSAHINRKFTPQLSGSAGFVAEVEEIDESGTPSETFALLSFPMSLRYSTVKNLLDPQRGFRVESSLAPYKAVNSDLAFTIGILAGSWYFPLLPERIVLAMRGKLGVIAGDSAQDIPADKRLYSGGGGSVRGYAFQELGPIDAFGDPAGGRALVETGGELRFRLSDSVGLVTFIEGGRVNRDIDFTGGEKFRWATGAGFRYYTAVGPLRGDVAVPLDKRSFDDNYQLYFSLGQAF